MRIVIVGGGWAGCAAAICARKSGIEVLMIERTDMLLGTGLVGGIMRNNGRYTATEEMIAMGGGNLFKICDKNSRHSNIDFPGHNHASLYDIAKVHGEVLRYLSNLDVKVIFNSRISNVKLKADRIVYIEDDKGNRYDGYTFIDATGTAGPIKNCTKYGNGCVMCIIRCPSFGGRISLTELAGVKEINGLKPDGSLGAMSGACKILKESLSKKIQRKLNSDGVAIIPIPKVLRENHLDIKACQQYALSEYRDNIILLDTGHAKLMSPYYDLEKLRQIPGFENARYEDPYAGGKGNSMRFFSMAPRDNYMKVDEIDNLFCCGERAGLLVGHTEAIVTGVLAGYNSVKYSLGSELLYIPNKLAVGDAIKYVGEQMKTEEGLKRKYTFSGSVYFNRMKEKSLYTTDIRKIQTKVEECNMKNIFNFSIQDN